MPFKNVPIARIMYAVFFLVMNLFFADSRACADNVTPPVASAQPITTIKRSEMGFEFSFPSEKLVEIIPQSSKNIILANRKWVEERLRKSDKKSLSEDVYPTLTLVEIQKPKNLADLVAEISKREIEDLKKIGATGITVLMANRVVASKFFSPAPIAVMFGYTMNRGDPKNPALVDFVLDVTLFLKDSKLYKLSYTDTKVGYKINSSLVDIVLGTIKPVPVSTKEAIFVPDTYKDSLNASFLSRNGVLLIEIIIFMVVLLLLIRRGMLSLDGLTKIYFAIFKK